MRRWCLVMAWLTLPVAARAEETKPILVLDAGGHTARVTKVLFSRDGKELISISNDKTIRFHDVSTGETLRVLRPPIGKGHEGKLFAAALSPDGKTLAVGGYGNPGDKWGAIYLIELPGGRIKRLLKGHTSAIVALAFSSSGKLLASGSFDKTARVWNVASGRCEHTLEGHKKDVSGVCFSPNGKSLATASDDKTARLWSVSSGKSQATLQGHVAELRCVAWSPDGKTVATGGYDQSIRLWDEDGAFRKAFPKLGNHITSLAFTADSRALLFTCGALPSSSVCSLLDVGSGRERVRFTKHDTTVVAGVLSPDGSLAATGDGLGCIHLWKTVDGSAVSRLAGKGKAAWAVGWSKVGRTIAWGNTGRQDTSNNYGPLERTFNRHELEFGKAPEDVFRRAQPSRGSLSLAATDRATVAVKNGHETVSRLKLSLEYDAVRCFTLLPGDRAAVGGEFGLYLFDTRSGKEIREFQGHTGVVWAVAPSPDNHYLLSGSDDQTVRIWNPEQEEPLLSLFFAGDDWIAWTPEGYYAASAGGEKLMGWHVNNGREQMATFHPAAQFRKTLYRPDAIKLLLETGSTAKALELADKARGKKSVRTEVRKVLPPRVVITSPAVSVVKLPKADLEVKATATSVGDHPVTELRLLIDGRVFQGAAGVKRIAEPKRGDVSVSWRVSLEPGKHRLAVLADSSVSQGRSEEVVVVYAGAEEGQPVKPTLYVLAIGVGAYKEKKLHLDYAGDDAAALVKALEKHSTSLFKSIESKVLTDKDATRKEVLKGVTWLRKQMTQRDYAVVFFSGHGHRDSDGTLYFLPVDVDADDVASTAVTADQVMNPLKSIPGKILVMLDACHSGGFAGPKKKSLTDDLVRDLVRDENGLAVMCSSTGREESVENNKLRLGTFTAAVVEGLSGKANKSLNGAVYLHHLDAYVTDRVKQLTRGQQHPVSRRPETVSSFPLSKP